MPELFQRTAANWDASYDERSSRGHLFRSRRDMAARAVGAGTGDLLDAGVGSGRLLAELARMGWRVFGLDAAPQMIELAARRVPEAAERLSVGRLERLPYPDESFDVVVSIGVLEYTDLDVTGPELVRVTRPGGRLVLGFRNGRAPVLLWRERVARPIARALGASSLPRRRRPASPDELAGLVREWGLSVEQIDAVDCSVLPAPLDQLLPGLAVSLAEAAERRKTLRRVLATQVVLTVRKTGLR
jgi:SAM-dependent methyltransferase